MASARAQWRASELGEAREVQVTGGRLRYFDAGAGPPIVFVHGLLVNANLWRNVVGRLSPDFRCITLEMPLGSHLLPLPDADLSAPGMANIIADAVEGIGLDDVTLVGNDTGGGLCQIAVTKRPERIGKLVLTSCDAFDNFPPTFFKYVLAPARLPGAHITMFGALRFRPARRLPIAFGWLTHEPIEREADDSYVYPVLNDKAIRGDLRRVMRGIKPRYTLEAAEKLRSFDRPALMAWGTEDRFCPPEHAERLANTIPDSRVEWIEGSYTFTPEDAPERLAELIAGFVREPRGERTGAR
jgi:pimeloyl-ACP methyl ester carboxylesterase